MAPVTVEPVPLSTVVMVSKLWMMKDGNRHEVTVGARQGGYVGSGWQASGNSGRAIDGLEAVSCQSDHFYQSVAPPATDLGFAGPS